MTRVQLEWKAEEGHVLYWLRQKNNHIGDGPWFGPFESEEKALEEATACGWRWFDVVQS